MKRNLKFCLLRLGREWPDFLLKTMQMCISLLLLGMIVNGFVQQMALHRQIQGLSGEKSLYVLGDHNTDEYWSALTEDDTYQYSFVRLVDTVLQMDTEFVVMNNVMVADLHGEQVDIIEVTPNFFGKYGISGSFDEGVLKKEFQIQKGKWQDTEEVIKPAILGCSYRGIYKQGDIIDDGEKNQYRVVGFLNSRQFYAAPMQGPEINFLDTAVITPVYINETDSDSMYNFLYGCQFLVDDISELEPLLQANREEKLLDSWLQSYEAQLRNVDKTYMNAAAMEGTLGVALFFFAFMGMLCTMIQRIEDNVYEYAVNLLCGARIYEIIFRVIFEFLLIMLLGDLLCVFMFGISYTSVTIVMLTLVCMVIICMFARKRVDAAKLTENLRRRD